MVETVLAYIEKDNQYLLLFRNKKKVDINKGKWIGVGGHIENNETPIDALIREVKEETNLDVLEYQKRGIVYFCYNDIVEKMHLFTVSKCSGVLSECNEGTLKYVDKKEMLNLPMWPGDKIFLKYLEEDEPYFELKLVYVNDELVSSTRIK